MGKSVSFSIQNQKKLLEDYAKEKGLSPIKHFSDDGISGTRFDRPAFMEVLDGINDGTIGTLIVKDMSRLGRDYLVVGQMQEILVKKSALHSRQKAKPGNMWQALLLMDI